jgi:putative spermidine/putrescine transport system substrate-binding protein
MIPGKMRSLSALVAVAVLFGWSAAAPARAEGTLAVHVGTGDWAEANFKAYVEPFEKATGIDVVPVQGWSTYADLKLWQESNNVQVDVMYMPPSDAVTSYQQGWLTDIDYGLYPKEQIDSIKPAARPPFGVGALYYSIALTYFNDAFAVDKAPKTWADLWNVEAFPGKRTMYSGHIGVGIWEIALLADGVAPENLYPIDFARATASLDKIRPHVVKWWEDGADNQQIFADRFVDLGPAYNGRMGNLQKEGLPLTIVWDQAVLYADYWVIPKGAKNAEGAQKFIQFATQAKPQATFAASIPYGPTNEAAYAYLDEAVAKQLPSHPDLIGKQVPFDASFYAQKDADGRTNLEKGVELWNEWILE